MHLTYLVKTRVAVYTNCNFLHPFLICSSFKFIEKTFEPYLFFIELNDVFNTRKWFYMSYFVNSIENKDSYTSNSISG